MVPTFTAVLRDSEIFSVRVTTDPRLNYIPPAIQKRWSEAAAAGAAIKSKSYEPKLQVLGAIHRDGVPLLAGTDAGWVQPYSYAGFSLHDELALLVRAGLTPMESLQTATINPARFLGIERTWGPLKRERSRISYCFTPIRLPISITLRKSPRCSWRENNSVARRWTKCCRMRKLPRSQLQ
jgi:hypothetical protein